MMLSLGLFVFELKTTSYETLSRQMAWKWQSQDRIGLRASQQYMGKGDDTISLNGTLMPELTGGDQELSILQKMADSGKAHILINGDGTVIGLFIITGLTQNHSAFFRDGKARKIAFTLSMKRMDDNAVDKLDNVSNYIQNLIASS